MSDKPTARDVIEVAAKKWEHRSVSPSDVATDILSALNSAGLEVVRSHKWHLPKGIGYECCKDCGIVRRGDDRHRPCLGPVRVGLRHHEPLKDEYTDAAPPKEN